jgi:hypothetical protein
MRMIYLIAFISCLILPWQMLYAQTEQEQQADRRSDADVIAVSVQAGADDAGPHRRHLSLEPGGYLPPAARVPG